jgi:dCTP diphosphatase
VSRLSELNALLSDFYAARDWRRFQTPKDVAASLAIEAAELQQLFLWLKPHEQRQRLVERRTDVEHELADVLINCLNLAHLAEIDLDSAFRRKLALLDAKYPVEEVHGRVVQDR